MGRNGNTWTAQAAPNPAHNAGTELSGVSCPSPAACFAVGDYFRTKALTDDPYPYWRQLRARCPVTREPHRAVYMVCLLYTSPSPRD